MRQSLRQVLSLVLVGGLIGCVTAPTATPINTQVGGAAAQALPRYSVGDKFTFVTSEGQTSTERVVAVNGDVISWLRGKSVNYTAYRNFILPELTYQTSTTTYNRGIETTPGFMFPLTQGKVEWFSITEKFTNSKTGATGTNRRNYKCQVKAPARLKVRAGVFDTIPVSCDRYSSSNFFYSATTWYYAPQLGHYVFYERAVNTKAGVQKSTRELMSFARGTEASKPSATSKNAATKPASGPETRPMPRRQSYQKFTAGLSQDVRNSLDPVMQTALQTQLNGQSVELPVQGGKATVAVTPTSVYPKRADGVWCRDFTTVVTQAGAKTSYSGMACKVRDKWRVQ